MAYDIEHGSAGGWRKAPPAMRELAKALRGAAGDVVPWDALGKEAREGYLADARVIYAALRSHGHGPKLITLGALPTSELNPSKGEGESNTVSVSAARGEDRGTGG